MFVLLMFFAVFNFAKASSSEITHVSSNYQQKVTIDDTKPLDCVEFPATLSCGISVWVTACNASVYQIVAAILIADVNICGFGVDEVIVTF